MQLSVDFEWTDAGQVILDSKHKLRFPPLPKAPGAYRLRLSGTGSVSVYIGETDNLYDRAMGYRNPGPSQQTNIRMNGRMTHHLEEGGRIEGAPHNGSYGFVGSGAEGEVPPPGTSRPTAWEARCSRSSQEGDRLIGGSLVAALPSRSSAR